MKRWFLCFAVMLLAVPLAGQVLNPQIVVSDFAGNQGWPQVCYNPVENNYLAVWEDYRNSRSDIYGQIINADGTLDGGNFPIVNSPGDQYWPRLDFDPAYNRYLIVFEEHRYQDDGDIAGVFVDHEGVKVPTAYSLADSTFIIDNDPGGIYICSVAFNYIDGLYLVVWGDFRNGVMWNEDDGDIYGAIVTADGEFLPLQGPAAPAKSSGHTGQPVSAEQGVNELVCDVSFNEEFRMWMVVFGVGKYMEDSVQGVLIDAYGRNIMMNGAPGFQRIPICAYTYWCPDGTQPRVQFNNETPVGLGKAAATWGYSEAEVVWRHAWMGDMGGYDIYGQRVALISHAVAHDLGWSPLSQEDTSCVVAYVDTMGVLSQGNLSNHPVCDAPQDQGVPDLAYGELDNEWCVAWGDERTSASWQQQDLYAQQLHVNNDGAMLWLADDRQSTVSSSVNTKLEDSGQYEGSLLGVAHNWQNNEHLIVFTYDNESGESDLRGRRIAGSQGGTGVEESIRPSDFKVFANYPNPFNPSTSIAYRAGKAGRLYGEVLDIRGRVVCVLTDKFVNAGAGELMWDGQDGEGIPAASGIYLYRLKFGDQVVTRKMMLLK